MAKNLARVPKRPLRVESGRAIVDADGRHLCNLTIKGADTWNEGFGPHDVDCFVHALVAAYNASTIEPHTEFRLPANKAE